MSLYKFAQYVVRFIMLFMFRIRCEGLENVPAEGALIMAANHRSDLDPPILGITSPRRLSFMAKSELFKNKLFGGLISRLGAFPVRRGTGDVGAFKTAIRIFKSGGAMIIFPEGGRVKKGQHRRAKAGVSAIAAKCGVPVVPVHICGEYKWMHRITVKFGKPMDFSGCKRLTSEETQALADKVLEKIYEL